MYKLKIEEKITFAYDFKVIKDYGTFEIPGHISKSGVVYYYDEASQKYISKDKTKIIDAKKYVLNLYKNSRYYKQCDVALLTMLANQVAKCNSTYLVASQFE